MDFIDRPYAGKPSLRFNEQTKVVEQRYKELGGEITVITNEHDARSPLASEAQTRAVDFILGKTK